LIRFIDSIENTVSNLSAVEVCLYIDEDDEPTRAIDFNLCCVTVLPFVGSKTTMGAMNTKAIEYSTGDIIMLCNDDVVIRSRNWDEKIIHLHNENCGRLYLAYPNDLFKGPALATFPIFPARLIKALCPWLFENYKGSFIDVHLHEIFLRMEVLNRGAQRVFYLNHVIFEHMHYRLNKSKFDATYRHRDRFADDEEFVVSVVARKKIALALSNLGDDPIKQSESLGDARTLRAKNITAGCISYIFDLSLPPRTRYKTLIWIVSRYVYKFLSRAVKEADSDRGSS
jgi:hypothetical protein